MDSLLRIKLPEALKHDRTDLRSTVVDDLLGHLCDRSKVAAHNWTCHPFAQSLTELAWDSMACFRRVSRQDDGCGLRKASEKKSRTELPIALNSRFVLVAEE